MMDITQMIVNMNISLRALNAKALDKGSKTDKESKVEVSLKFDVKNAEQFETITKKLREIDGVLEVSGQ